MDTTTLKPIIEAMMMGNIVIVPDKGAQLEYVEDGMSGFLFREHSVAGVLVAIQNILDHEDLDRLAIESRHRIRKFYGAE